MITKTAPTVRHRDVGDKYFLFICKPTVKIFYDYIADIRDIITQKYPLFGQSLWTICVYLWMQMYRKKFFLHADCREYLVNTTMVTKGQIIKPTICFIDLLACQLTY